MGLLDDSPERWDNFRARIIQLNEQLKKENAEAKVFFFARHGQGWRTFVLVYRYISSSCSSSQIMSQKPNMEHNIGMSEYFVFFPFMKMRFLKCRTREMSKRCRDNEITWGRMFFSVFAIDFDVEGMVLADPELTEIGINQALEAKRGWEAELPFKITLPEKLYSSPLTRALDTLRITFQDITTGEVENKRVVKVLEVNF